MIISQDVLLIKRKKFFLILSVVLILYFLIALICDYRAFNHGDYPQMYLYKQAEWYPALVHRAGGEEYIEGQYSYHGWCYTIEMKVYKNMQTKQVYNFFSGCGTAVSYRIFGKTLTRHFYNGVSIPLSNLSEMHE